MDAELIVSYLSGNISDHDKVRVDTWRQQPSNEKIFISYQETWELSAKDRESILPDTDLAWKNISEQIKKVSTPSRVSAWPIRWLAAAAILLIIPALFFFNKKGQTIKGKAIAPTAVPLQPPSITEVYTSDSLAQFYLPDSSRVLLNRSSRLTFPERFEGEKRVARLTGEAFFEIKPDKAHPFVIEAGSSVIKVLGTTFNLKATSDTDIELTVVTGTVEFAAGTIPGKPKLVITENHKASLKQKEISTEKHDKKQKEWWHERKKNRFKRFLGKIRTIFNKEP